MAPRKRKVTNKKARPAKKSAAKKTTTTAAPKRSRVKARPVESTTVDPDATVQVPVAEVLGDIEETMALDRLREER